MFHDYRFLLSVNIGIYYYFLYDTSKKILLLLRRIFRMNHLTLKCVNVTTLIENDIGCRIIYNHILFCIWPLLE